MDRERLRRPKPPVTGTAAASDAVLRERGPEPMARLGPCVGQGRLHGIRTEIGLAPENRDRWQRVGRRPCARTCRLQEQAANGRSRRTLDLLQARRRTSVRTNQNLPANSAFSLERRTIRPRRVRSQSDPTQTHKPTAQAKKTCKCRSFQERLTGFRTLDLLHGKQSGGLGAARNTPANRPLLPRERVPPMPGFYHEITGVSGLKPDWR
jgi:hypothetical protein